MKENQSSAATQVIVENLNEFPAVANTLLSKYPSHRLFAFFGAMGVGKTTFIKSLCDSLKVTDIVSSPTFALVNVYSMQHQEQLYHFDFYRIKNIVEAYDIGYEDYFYSGNYCFIEWPEMVEPLLPEDCVKVYMELDPSNNDRLIKF